MWRSRNPHTLLAGTYKMVQPLWKIVWWFLKWLNIELPYEPAIPLLGIYPKEMKTYAHTETCTWIFTTALFTITKRWKQPKCPSTDKWINKIWHPYNGILFSYKKEWSTNTYATTWMNLENLMLSKGSQSQKTIYYMIPLIWKFRKGKHIETESRLVDA